MPRRYSMTRRAEQQADTRARILAAAIDIYRADGLAAATIPAVARAADVAPATVRRYFPTPGDIASAAGEVVLEGLRPPGPEIFDGVATLPERVQTLARALVAFFERGEGWWLLVQREPQLAQAWAGAEAAYERSRDTLVRAALGPLAADRVALAVLASVVAPPFHYGLRASGLSADEAVDAQVALVVPWLEGRRG